MSQLQRFFTDKKGAAAVEFAMVSMLTITSIIFVMMVGLIIYLNLELDNATSRAARQVMVGKVQTQNVSQSDFRTKYVCAYLPSTMSCANIIVNLQTVTQAGSPSGYYAYVNSTTTALTLPTASSAFSTGSQGSFEYLQVSYPVTFLPSFLANLLSNGTFNGAPALLITSTAAFKNEQF